MSGPARLTIMLVAVCGICLLWGFGGQEGTTPQLDKNKNDMVVTGPIMQWFVRADGSLAIQIDGSLVGAKPERDQQGRPLAESKVLWLETPPDQTDATRFEDLSLQILLAQEARPDKPLTFWLQEARSRDGSSVDKAIKIAAIGRGVR